MQDIGVKFSGTHFWSGITETDQLVQKLEENAHKRLSLSPRTTSLPLANKVNYKINQSYFNFLLDEESQDQFDFSRLEHNPVITTQV